MINVTVGEHKTQSEKPFPKLMVYSKYGSIIFATNKSGKRLTGILLFAGTSCDRPGIYSNFWLESNFVDYNKPLILQNA